MATSSTPAAAILSRALVRPALPMVTIVGFPVTAMQSPAKIAVRDRLMTVRRRRPVAELGAGARALAEHLLDTVDVRRAATVAAYVSMNGSPVPAPAGRAARGRQARHPAGAAARRRPRLGGLPLPDDLAPARWGCSSRSASARSRRDRHRRRGPRAGAGRLVDRDAPGPRRRLLRPRPGPGPGRHLHLCAALRRGGRRRRPRRAARPPRPHAATPASAGSVESRLPSVESRFRRSSRDFRRSSRDIVNDGGQKARLKRDGTLDSTVGGVGSRVSTSSPARSTASG